MRVPAGAPVPFWLSVKNKFPVLHTLSKPSLGTIGVLCTLAVTFVAAYSVCIYPKVHNDYYKKVQAEERALLHATKEELAQHQNTWKDPFSRKN